MIIENAKLDDGAAIAGADIMAVLVIDAEGRVFQVTDGIITNASLSQVINARTAIIEMMDRLGVRDLHAFNLLDRQGDGDLPTAMDIAIAIGEDSHARTGVTPAMRDLMALYKRNQKGHPPACCCAECAKDWMGDGEDAV